MFGWDYNVIMQSTIRSSRPVRIDPEFEWGPTDDRSIVVMNFIHDEVHEVIDIRHDS